MQTLQLAVQFGVGILRIGLAHNDLCQYHTLTYSCFAIYIVHIMYYCLLRVYYYTTFRLLITICLVSSA